MVYEKISGFSDEIASDIDTQFRVLKQLGISYFEPRGIDGKNISMLTDEEVKELKRKMVLIVKFSASHFSFSSRIKRRHRIN